MTATRRNIKCLIILIGFLPFCFPSSAQKKLGLEADKWATELSKNKLSQVNSLGALINLLREADSARAFGSLDSIESSKNADGYFFRTYFNMVKADFLYYRFADVDKYKDRRSKELQPIKEQMMKLYNDALDAVYHTDDDLAIGWASFYFAKRMRSFGEVGWAVMYSKNGVDLFEKVGYNVEPPVYTELAELLYQVREYDESFIYAKKGIAAWKKVKDENEYVNRHKYQIRALNTIGTINYENNKYDSALSYFEQALAIARQNKDTLFRGIVLGNIGRVMFAQNKIDSAYVLFKTDYNYSENDSVYNNAANAAQWAAKANLVKGNKSGALIEAREALRLLKLWPNGPYLRDTYQTLTRIFKSTNQYDSAFYYNDQYVAINDSLEKEVATSSLAISKAKLNDEISRFNIQKLNREKKNEVLWRNIIIVSIIVVSMLGLLLINRQRLKEKIKTDMAELEKRRIIQEKQLMEQEINSAREQMKMFTDNIVEKTNLIEKLELQVKDKHATGEQQAIISELSQQSILTEQDWFKFKNLFEKIHPGFFNEIKIKFPDITLAEQRTAALTRLQFTTRQIASILGISTDSVHKSRQRLRQRFQVGTEANLEDLVKNL